MRDWKAEETERREKCRPGEGDVQTCRACGKRIQTRVNGWPRKHKCLHGPRCRGAMGMVSDCPECLRELAEAQARAEVA